MQICEKINLINLDKNTIDAKILDSLDVIIKNFRFALDVSISLLFAKSLL